MWSSSKILLHLKMFCWTTQYCGHESLIAVHENYHFPGKVKKKHGKVTCWSVLAICFCLLLYLAVIRYLDMFLSNFRNLNPEGVINSFTTSLFGTL
jgi:hypothetical protein